MRFCALLIAIAALAVAQPAQSTVIHVPGDYETIADGLDNAAYGDTVRVGIGTYREWNLSIPSGVTLESEGHTASCVTFDGMSGGPIIEIVGSTDFVIDGFTFLSANGMASGGALYYASPIRPATPGLMRNCAFEENMCASGYNGGAVFIQYGSLDFENCTFSQNGSGTNCTSGGAVHVNSGKASFSDCVFYGNSAERGGAVAAEGGSTLSFDGCEFNVNGSSYYDGGYGGGAAWFFKNVNATFNDCAFEANAATYDGGAVCTASEFGLSASCTFSDCEFQNNTAGNRGGGVALCHAEACSLGSCTFTTNSASLGGGLLLEESEYITVDACRFSSNYALSVDGGGAYLIGAGAWLHHCLFDGNAAQGVGGALFLQGSAASEVTDCTLVNNTAEGGGTAAYLLASSGLEFDRVVIAMNGPGQPVSGASTPQMSCTDIWGHDDGNWVGSIASQESDPDNFSEDPLFCDVFSNDYSLCDNSPCLDTSSPCGQTIGAFGAGGCGNCDAPAENVSWGAIKALYR